MLIVDRQSFKLTLFKDLKREKTYNIAVGKVGMDTPAGLYSIQNKAIDPAWRLCPYCEAETGATPPASSGRRRRRGSTTSEDAVAEASPRSSR